VEKTHSDSEETFWVHKISTKHERLGEFHNLIYYLFKDEDVFTHFRLSTNTVNQVGFEVLMAVSMKMTVFWVVACRLIEVY
jgi:hypothetical protein